jgi:hypothetical protein
VFEIVHEKGHHQVLVAEGFLRANRDAAAELHESELADYLHEARAQRRRFLVRKEDGAVRAACNGNNPAGESPVAVSLQGRGVVIPDSGGE